MIRAVRWWEAMTLAVTLAACAVPSSTAPVPHSPSPSVSSATVPTDPTSTAAATPPEASDTSGPSGSETSAGSGARAAGLRRLARLRVVDRVRPDTYDRDAFGSAWADIDGNGCNQRDDVLLRDAVPGTTTTATEGNCDHDVLAGTWIDPYTGASMTFDDLKDLRQAQAVQIDLVVPLSEAWVSGADQWNDERRHSFANDLRNLLAVDGPTNASKGDDDPAAWRPKKSYQCAYATRWIRVKSRYQLAIDSSEALALTEMLGYC